MTRAGRPEPSDFLARLARDPALGAGLPDFADTATAFADKSDAELARVARLYGAMNEPALVRFGSAFGAWAVRNRLPFAERAALATIYKQFVGGRTLPEAAAAADRLAASGVLTILDYGAEGKNDEESHRQTLADCLESLTFAGGHRTVPVLSMKVSGLADDKLLEAISETQDVGYGREHAYAKLLARLDTICSYGAELGVGLYVDAEESWLQPAIDEAVMEMMLRHNRGKAVVFNTYQLYRHESLANFERDHARCREAGVVLGAKLVRGAYMEKERARAAELGYESPIQTDRAATDRDFDRAVEYALDHIDEVSFCNASHNQASIELMARGMLERQLNPAHPHVMFCQLYGMSDNLTYNLSAAGYRVSKYMPYGPVRDVVPYLVRRAQENTSVTGDASRELQLVRQELRRRAGAPG